MEKDVIFIGHSSEEMDTYFAVWLKSKLELFGYKTFCDIEDLGSGSFWYEIDRVLCNETIKFLPIITTSYIIKSKQVGTGVERELTRVMTLLKENPKIAIPVRIDNSNWEDFNISIVGFEGSDFSKGWLDGLRKLIRLLDKDKTPLKRKDDGFRHIVDDWLKALKIKDNLLTKEERYYTNWFPITLPEFIFIYDLKFALENSPYKIPFAKKIENNLVITFCDNDEIKNYIIYESFLKKPTKDFFQQLPIDFDNARSIKEPNKKLVEILNQAFINFLKNEKKTKTFSLSGSKEIFYFLDKTFINLNHLGKTRRQLSGKEKEFNWHFAIGINAFLHPSPNYFFTSHIVFTQKGLILKDKKLRHRLRRKVAKDWYNRKWFETILAATTYLSNVENKSRILIPVSSKDLISIDTIPLSWLSKVGYLEPSKVEEE